MPEYRYPAVLVRQTPTGEPLVLFAAPAVEIEQWSGIPQKQELNGDETTGFQREENIERVAKLRQFYSEKRNVVQNPLLCAIRSEDEVRFVPGAGAEESNAQPGEIVIAFKDLEELPLLELLQRLQKQLQDRMGEIGRDFKVPEELVRRVKERANIQPQDEGEIIAPENMDEFDEASRESEFPDVLLIEDSHIKEFWEAVAARVIALRELPQDDNRDEFAGFSKDAVISYLRPVVVVDGQHRLLGAVELARVEADAADIREQIRRDLAEGIDPRVAQARAERSVSRILPVSLLMTDDPAEHVFQFIVVNQKAMPLGRALLGTIVATTLTTQEVSRVSERLSDSGIPLEQSQVIAFLSRNPESPFRSLVERGIGSESGGQLLPWTVLGSLVRIFRDLRGGRLFHERNDYAEKWARDFLPQSALVADYEDRGYESALEMWRQPDGPWRPVFLRFWETVRDEFASKDDEQAPNFWGAPRVSNLFNKISLTILAADFFRFLCEARQPINHPNEVPDLVSHEWLKGVNRTYFNRNWQLEGVKKDSTGIRNKWAQIWDQYRKDPVQLPRIGEYRKPARV